MRNEAPRPPALRIDARDPRPIWRQIEEGLLAAIATGALAVGEVIPSVRELAKQLRVNPNTIARVYQRLAEAGILETRRGEGSFVARNPPTMPAREQQRRLAEAAERFAVTVVGLRTTPDEALAAVRRALTSHVSDDKEAS
jgi:GntR family transcriptional regulator